MKNFFRKAIYGCVFLCALAFGGCAPRGPVSRTSFYFNTVIQVTLYDSDDTALLDRCMELAAHYEALFSATAEGTDVWNINHAEGIPVAVDPETVTLLDTALYYAALSNGRFNPAIGAVSTLWNFSGEPPGPVPSADALSAALAHTDPKAVAITGNMVVLTDPDARIDPGGIAKGYIADRMKEYLLSEGVESAIINLGGNVLLIGEKTDGTPFQIGIQDPFDPAAYIVSLPASDCSVVSSGIYERYFEEDGIRYHHLLDTDTGYPLDNGLAGVTILSERSVDGDALSTTCFALGQEAGMALVESLPDTEALFILTDGTLLYSSGFPCE